MKNKKGFTLIELLAILVILAIIALIAIPVVLNIIDRVRFASYARSADNILDASRIYFKETQIDSTMSIEGNNYDKVMESMAGRKPDSGEIYIKNTGEIALALKYDKYCFSKNYEDVMIDYEISETCTIGTSSTPDEKNPNEDDPESGDDYITVDDLIDDIPEDEEDDDDEHRYRGSDPNNYIYLDEELYRIMAINDQGIKVIKAFEFDNIDDWVTRCRFDTNKDSLSEVEPRNNSNNTYCKAAVGSMPWESEKYGGCNIWATANTINQNGTVSDTITNNNEVGTVTENSIIYNYLYNTYYPANIIESDQYIIKNATWNIGPVTGAEPFLLDAIKEDEDNWTWTGKMSLMTISDYIGAQSSSIDEHTSCLADIYNNDDCEVDNWLNLSKYNTSFKEWTINPVSGSSTNLWTIKFGSVYIDSASPSSSLDCIYYRPVLYIRSDVKLSGEGSYQVPYRIEGLKA